MFDLLTGSDEAEVYERGNANAGYCVPLEYVDELEGECEQIEPHGAANIFSLGVGSRIRSQLTV